MYMSRDVATQGGWMNTSEDVVVAYNVARSEEDEVGSRLVITINIVDVVFALSLLEIHFRGDELDMCCVLVKMASSAYVRWGR